MNFDVFPSMMHLPSIDVEHMKAVLFEFVDDPQTRIDSVWWNFTEGNEAYGPAKILPFIDAPPYGEWQETGFDPVQTSWMRRAAGDWRRSSPTASTARTTTWRAALHGWP